MATAPEKPEWVVAGLGNPGPQYVKTRHNVGTRTVELLAKRRGVSFSKKGDCLWARCRLLVGDVYLILPQTFMNESGKAVASFMRFRKIPPRKLIAVTDDMDLPPGKIRLKPAGSSAGHHGMDSLMERLKTSDFARVRVGIGKPAAPFLGAEYVLAPIPPEDRLLLEKAVQRAADCVEVMIQKGMDAAMNEFNSDLKE